MSSDPGTPRQKDSGGRFARWWSGWRFALKIGFRDCLRHRGRSLLVMILIGVPVLIVTAGLTVYGSMAGLRPDEAAMADPGGAQAAVSVPWGDPPQAIEHDAYGLQVTGLGPARARPGQKSTAPWRSGDVAALLPHSTVAALGSPYDYLISYSGPSPVGVRILTVDSPSIGDFGLAELIEGRWPAGPGELVVTDRGIQPGVPRTGPISVSIDGVEQDATVVGVVRAPTTATWTVIRSGPVTGEAWRFLVQRPEPVTQAEVQRLNEYGLVVRSRSLMAAAPPYVAPAGEEALTPGESFIGSVGSDLGPEQRITQLIQIAAISVGILIEVVLLAGPAFALGAAQQRRIWALIAACGADRRQLRRIVLGQSVVLGGAAAVAGTALGLAVSPLAAHLLWWSRVIDSYGPWRPPVYLIVAVAVAAVVAAMIAAIGPARAAVRRDVASTLNERWQPPAARPGVPWIGAGLAVLATAGMIGAGTAGHDRWWAWPVVIAGCVVLTAGCLMILPALAAGWGRVGHRWPLPIRLAARDVGRQHQRSVPAIAAVAAATAVLAAFGVLFASQTALAVKVHTPVTTPGQAVLSDFTSDKALRGSIDRIRQPFPDWNYLERDRMIDRPVDAGWATFYSTMEVVPAGCTEADLLRDDERCSAWDNPFASPLIQDIPASDHALAPESAAALRAGKILITDPALIVDGRVRLIRITEGRESDASAVTRRVELPAVLVDPASLIGTLHHTTARTFEPYGWMLPRTADANDLPRRLDRVMFGPLGRDITAAEGATIMQLIDPEQPLTIERGHVDDQQSKLLPLLLAAGLLVLLAAVVATALAQVDGRSEQSTLAAVGAAPAVRRGQAAGQALLLSATGMIFGALAGLVPGVAIALLDQPPGAVAPGPQLALPWAGLGVLIITVPLIAAGLAACTTRTPRLSRRPT